MKIQKANDFKIPNLTKRKDLKMPFNFFCHFIILTGFCAQMVLTDCPRGCECKWKAGKQSVICINTNLSVIPTTLEIGTQALDLTGNNIASIKHDEFNSAGLINLQKIYISKCRLKQLERYAFRNLINLVELDLSYNVLTTVPSHTFDSISELRELKLSGNPIQKIANNAFVNVPHLIRLELTDCRLTTIETNAFHGLEAKLGWLKIDKNKLVQVRSITLTRLENLNGIELADNPWNCSCSIRPLREWMLRHNVPFGVPPICHQPKRLAMKAWDKLELDDFACAPAIVPFSSVTRGVEGGNITMGCWITGVPEPNVKWTVKNKVIANLSAHTILNGKKYFVVHMKNNLSDLTISNAELIDSGMYMCTAENKAGRAEASVTLSVSKKPPDGFFHNKFLLASALAIVGVGLVLIIAAVSVCSLRRKKVKRWLTPEANQEDDYEKMEMNHKMTENTNGGVMNARPEISIVVNSRKNGDYSVIPEKDEEQLEAEAERKSMEERRNMDWNCKIITPEKNWTSRDPIYDPKDLLDRMYDPNDMRDRKYDLKDLHIPRRQLPDLKTDFDGATSIQPAANYQPYQDEATTSLAFQERPLWSPITTKLLESSSKPLPSSSYTRDYPVNLSSIQEKKFPDVIENHKFNPLHSRLRKANSEGGSVTDITELFCTLPRKPTRKYRSTDSQAPLLLESRYGSSSESYASQESPLRRMSDFHLSLGRTRVGKMSGSYQNLSRNNSFMPLMNGTGLENRVQASPETILPTSVAQNANSYDYHAAQLERFLEEYRSLQKELTKMKETCSKLKTPATYDESDKNMSASSGCDSKTNQATATVQSIKNSDDFKKFENELTKLLLEKTLMDKQKLNKLN